VIYFFVEGPDDRDFIDRLLKPMLGKGVGGVLAITYAKGGIKAERYLRSQQCSSYICLGDKDDRECFTVARTYIRRIVGLEIEDSRVVIVSKSIESWYLAGADHEMCKKYGIRYEQSVDNINKGIFKSYCSKAELLHRQLVQNLTESYCFETALSRSSSLRYLFAKILPEHKLACARQQCATRKGRPQKGLCGQGCVVS